MFNAKEVCGNYLKLNNKKGLIVEKYIKIMAARMQAVIKAKGGHIKYTRSLTVLEDYHEEDSYRGQIYSNRSSIV